MSIIIKLSLVAVIGALLVSFLRPISPAVAVMLSLVCGVTMLICIFEPLADIFNQMSDIMASAGLDGSIYFPVLKAVGISVLVRIVSELCRDAGQGSLAAKLELAGAVLAVSVCIPLVQQVFTLMGMILE